MIVDILQPAEWRVSSPVETPPWGFSSPFPFMNIGMDLQLPQMAPEALLDALQAIERSISSMPHRNADGSYRDREIDIDIILIDSLRMVSARLVLPHPRMLEREFRMAGRKSAKRVQIGREVVGQFQPELFAQAVAGAFHTAYLAIGECGYLLGVESQI